MGKWMDGQTTRDSSQHASDGHRHADGAAAKLHIDTNEQNISEKTEISRGKLKIIFLGKI